MHPRTLGWWLVVAALTLGTPAWAHVDTASAPVVSMPLGAETLTAATPPVDGPWTLLSALAVAAVLIARRRRAVAVACFALLLVVAFEAGVHSVHHLADALDAGCVVASASAHTGGVTVDTVAFERRTAVTMPVAVAPMAPIALRPAAPDFGRAPPTA